MYNNEHDGTHYKHDERSVDGQDCIDGIDGRDSNYDGSTISNDDMIVLIIMMAMILIMVIMIRSCQLQYA